MKYKPDFLIKPYFLYEDKEIKPLDRDVFAIIYYFVKMKGKKCTAGNSTMAKLINSSAGSIANSLVKLEKLGYIKRVFKDEKKLIRSEIIPLVNFVRVSPVGEGGFTCGLRGVSPVGEQISNNNKEKNNIVEASSTKEKIDDKEIKMDIKDFEVYCKKSPHKHIHFIADWARATKPNCDNLAEWKVYIKRNLKASIQTVKFSEDKIKTAFKKMKDASETLNFTPTIETLNKYLTK